MPILAVAALYFLTSSISSGLELDVGSACEVDIVSLRRLLELEGLKGSLALRCEGSQATLRLDSSEASRVFDLGKRTEPALSRYIALVARESMAWNPVEPELPGPEVELERAATRSAKLEGAAGFRAVFSDGPPLYGVGTSAAYTWNRWGGSLELLWARGDASTNLGEVEADLFSGKLSIHRAFVAQALALRVGAGLEVGALWGRGSARPNAQDRSSVVPIFGPTLTVDSNFFRWGPLSVHTSATLGYATQGGEVTSDDEATFRIDGVHGWLGFGFGFGEEDSPP